MKILKQKSKKMVRVFLASVDLNTEQIADKLKKKNILNRSAASLRQSINNGSISLSDFLGMLEATNTEMNFKKNKE